jgi:hypothetical protein
VLCGKIYEKLKKKAVILRSVSDEESGPGRMIDEERFFANML